MDDEYEVNSVFNFQDPIFSRTIFGIASQILDTIVDMLC